MAGLSEGQLAGASEEGLGSQRAVVPMMMMIQDTVCLLSNARPCWAPYTLLQVHNPIAAELYYFEHSYREHFVSVPLELMLVHATQFVNEISPSATDTLYTE